MYSKIRQDQTVTSLPVASSRWSVGWTSTGRWWWTSDSCSCEPHDKAPPLRSYPDFWLDGNSWRKLLTGKQETKCQRDSLDVDSVMSHTNAAKTRRRVCLNSKINWFIYFWMCFSSTFFFFQHFEVLPVFLNTFQNKGNTCETTEALSLAPPPGSLNEECKTYFWRSKLIFVLVYFCWNFR